MQVTELWAKKDFALTYSWIHNILRSVVPLCIMCTLNCFIVNALRRTSRHLAASTRRRELDRRRTMSPRNRRVTLMLVAVIGLFIVCVTPVLSSRPAVPTPRTRPAFSKPRPKTRPTPSRPRPRPAFSKPRPIPTPSRPRPALWRPR